MKKNTEYFYDPNTNSYYPMKPHDGDGSNNKEIAAVVVVAFFIIAVVAFIFDVHENKQKAELVRLMQENTQLKDQLLKNGIPAIVVVPGSNN